MEYGYIQGTQHYNTLGQIERIDYEWIGSKYAQLQYPLGSYNLQWKKDGNNVRIGPYRAYIVEEEFYGYVIVRKVGLWQILVIWHKLNRSLEIAYHRFIITLSVWGLAKYSGETTPILDDIYLVSKIKKIFHKK